MKKLIKLLFVFAAFAFLTVQCEEDDDKYSSPSTTFVVNASDSIAWKYFSFEKGDTVQISDPKNDLNWDIAFKRSAIKTNGGLSGKGITGIFETKLVDKTGYDALSVVPDTAVFTSDDTVVNYGRNGAETKAILNGVLNNWYSYNPANNGVLPSKNNIYLVKTANGKYAKLWIKSYYRDTDSKAGYFKIQYFYQKDGSTNLK